VSDVESQGSEESEEEGEIGDSLSTVLKIGKGKDVNQGEERKRNIQRQSAGKPAYFGKDFG
jgi:hypothetical protein